MALTWDQISAITRRKFLPKMVDNIFDSNPGLERMRRKNLLSVDGGTTINQPLLYATTSASGVYDGTDTLNITDNEQMTDAEYAWKYTYASIVIKKTDELKNSGDSKVISLVKTKTMAAEQTLVDNWGTYFWNAGTVAKAPHGLRFLLSTSNTVGGISQTSYSWWASQYDSSSTVVSLANLQTQFNLASIGNDAPTVGFTTRTVYNLYYNLLTPQQRFQDKDTAKAGFSSLMFNGVPIIVDSHAPASHLAFINEKYLKLVIHKDDNFKMENFVRPVNQRIRVAQIFATGNFVSSNNRMHALFTALAS